MTETDVNNATLQRPGGNHTFDSKGDGVALGWCTVLVSEEGARPRVRVTAVHESLMLHYKSQQPVAGGKPSLNQICCTRYFASYRAVILPL